MSGVSQLVLVDPSTQAENFQSGKAGAAYVLMCDATGTPIAGSNPISVTSAAVRTVQTLTITAGTTVSPSLDLQYTSLVGFTTPAVWNAGGLTIEVSVDNSVWNFTTYDGSGLQVSNWAALATTTAYAVDALAMMPFRYIRLRSGSNAVPITQVADRVFNVITRPLA